ncbi:MAG: zinc-binding dehydrogenase [Gammaproteobacteria bacterium]
MSETMKAVVLHRTGGPQALCVEQVPVPRPRRGEVRVALRAAAINRRDVWITLDRYPGMKLPCILGSDGAGVVDAIGEDVDPALMGREVVIYPAAGWGDDPRAGGRQFHVLGMPDPGTFAGWICRPAEGIYPRPAHLDWHQAASLPLCGLTAWRALVTQAGVDARCRVLVTGIGGGVATTALLLAVHLGAEVWVSSSSAEKIARAVALGAAGGIDYRDADWATRLRKRAGPMDAVIDGTGGIDIIRALEVLAPGGRAVVYGATAGNPPTGPNMAQLFFRQIQLRGSTMGTPFDFAAMLDFVNAKRIVPVVDRICALDDAVAAHEHVLQARQMGKVVLAI